MNKRSPSVSQVPWPSGSSNRRTVIQDETEALPRAVSMGASRLGSAHLIERLFNPQENSAESSGSGHIPDYFTEASGKEKRRRYRTLKTRAIASLKSNARVLEMSFMENFGDFKNILPLEKNRMMWAYN